MKNKRKKRWISNRQKAILSFCIPYAFITAYFFYFSAVNQHKTLEKDIIQAAAMKGRLISAALAKAMSVKDKIFIKDYINHVLGDDTIYFVRLTDFNGGVVAQAGLAKNTKIVTGKGDFKVQEIGRAKGIFHESGHIFFMQLPVAQAGKNVGELYLEINTVAGNRRLATVTIRWLALILITFAIGALVTYLLEKKMRRSLGKIITTTKQMAMGNLTQHVAMDNNIGKEVEELVTSFNQMAGSLSEKEKELTAGRNTLVAMFNGITAGIAYVSKDFTILYANRAYASLVRDVDATSPTEGFKCFEVLWQDHDTCKKCAAKSSLITGEPREWEREVTLKNGQRQVFSIHTYPVSEKDKNTIGFVEYVMDITRQKQMENELKNYTEHLEEIIQERTRKLKEAQVQIVHQEKIAALGQMAMGIAHEIGNPLTVLSTLVRTYHISDQNSSAEEKSKVMQEQVERIVKIVRELADFSRPASDSKTLTHCNQIIRSVLGMARYDSRFKKIIVQTALDNNIPAVKLNGDQLLQVFLNIIINAADAMNGEGALTITSKLETNSVVFAFADAGPGIPEDLLTRIFEPFFTTKEVGQGTGLGLSVSCGIIKNMGGQIRASNKTGGGAVFTIEIPLPGLIRGNI